MRCLVLGALVGVGGCASVEYRVPTWEVQRLDAAPASDARRRGARGPVRCRRPATGPPGRRGTASARGRPRRRRDSGGRGAAAGGLPTPGRDDRRCGPTRRAARGAAGGGQGQRERRRVETGAGARPPDPRGVRPVERRPTRRSRWRRRCRCRRGSGRRGCAHRDLGGRSRHGGGGRRRAPVRRVGCGRCRPPAAPLLRRRPGTRGAAGAARPRGSDRPSERRSGRRRRARPTNAAAPAARRRRPSASSSGPAFARSSGAGAGPHRSPPRRFLRPPQPRLQPRECRRRHPPPHRCPSHRCPIQRRPDFKTNPRCHRRAARYRAAS